MGDKSKWMNQILQADELRTYNKNGTHVTKVTTAIMAYFKISPLISYAGMN